MKVCAVFCLCLLAVPAAAQWRPGQRLAWIETRGALPEEEYPYKKSRVWVADADGSAPSPVIEPQAYGDRFELGTLPVRICCHTEDGYFVQVEVSYLNHADGTTRVESWFQSIKGLRLLRHG